MIDPVNPNVGLMSGCTATDIDSLKHWIKELTDLSPQQVEYVLAQQLLAQREQLTLTASLSN